MINTIFYFTPTLTFEQYLAKLGDEISYRTIVFAEAEHAIYKGGVKYGGVTSTDFLKIVEDLYDDSWIKEAFDQFSSDISDAKSRINTLQGLIDTINQYLDGLLDDVKLEILDKIEELFEKSDWIHEHFPMDEIWGTSNFGMKGAVKEYLQMLGLWSFDEMVVFEKLSSFDGTPDITANVPLDYLDLHLNEWIPQDKLFGTYILSLSVVRSISRIEPGDSEILKNTIGGVTSYYNVRKSLDGQQITKWSEINQTISQIQSSVNEVITDGTLSQALSSTITQLINDATGSISTNISNIWATLNLAKDIIEWMYSGFSSTTNEHQSISDIHSAGGNALIDALSEVRTTVEKLNDGSFIAEADMSAKINDTIASLIAHVGPIEGSNNQNVLAGLSAKADANSDNIAAMLVGMGINNATADIHTAISNAMSGFLSEAKLNENGMNTAKSALYSAIGAQVGTDEHGNPEYETIAGLRSYCDLIEQDIQVLTRNNDYSAGIITQSTLGSSIASLFASNSSVAGSQTAKNSVAASVTAYIQGDTSTLELIASHVNVNSQLTSFTGDVVATSFVTGNSGDYGISAITGQFNPSSITNNIKKAYFAYDANQGAVTLWFYQNNTWKRIDIGQTAVIDSVASFEARTFYILNESGTTLPTESVLTSGNNVVTLYYNYATGKYYNTQSTIDPATGVTYYKINRSITSVPNWYRNEGNNETDLRANPFDLSGLGNELVCAQVLDITGLRDNGSTAAGISGRASTECACQCLYAATVEKCVFTNGSMNVAGTCDVYYTASSVTADGNGAISTVTISPMYVKKQYNASSPFVINLGSRCYEIPASTYANHTPGTNDLLCWYCSYLPTTLGDALNPQTSPTPYNFKEYVNKVPYNLSTDLLSQHNPSDITYID